jgi:hypothetical protein
MPQNDHYVCRLIDITEQQLITLPDKFDCLFELDEKRKIRETSWK